MDSLFRHLEIVELDEEAWQVQCPIVVPSGNWDGKFSGLVAWSQNRVLILSVNTCVGDSEA